MKSTIKSEIYFDGTHYCARCIDFDIFTQGATLDEAVKNLKEAIQLHFEDDSEELEGYVPTPSIFSMMDLGQLHV